MERVVPFRAVIVVVQVIMTLRAIACRVVDGNGIGVSHEALRIQMLAAGAVAVFALDIGQILHRRRHGSPIAVGQHRRKRPAIQRGHIVKTAVDGEGIGIVADGVTYNATLVVMAGEQTVNGPGEHRSVRRVSVCGVNTRHERTIYNRSAAMAGGAGLEAKGGARRDFGRKIGRTAAHRGNRGIDRVLSDYVWAKKGAARQLIGRAAALTGVTIRCIEKRHVGAERPAGQSGQRSDRLVAGNQREHGAVVDPESTRLKSSHRWTSEGGAPQYLPSFPPRRSPDLRGTLVPSARLDKVANKPTGLLLATRDKPVGS